MYFIVRPNSNGNLRLDTGEVLFPNLEDIDIKYNSDLFIELCRLLQITNIHVNHTVGYDENFVDVIIDAKNKLQIPIVYTLHDYFVFCPLCNLFGNNDQACLEINLDKCGLCSKKWGLIPAHKQRELYSKLLNAASRITVPNLDVQKRILSVYPSLEIDVVPHEENSNLYNLPVDVEGGNESLRLGFIGAINKAKGSLFIRKLGEFFKNESIDKSVELFVMGYTDRDQELKNVGVEVLGKYNSEQEVRKWIVKNKVNALMIPSIWPETYCYTLSIALRTGLPVFTFDIGAQAERMVAAGRKNFLIPIQKVNDFQFIVNFINQKRKSSRSFPKMDKQEVPLNRYYE